MNATLDFIYLDKAMISISEHNDDDDAHLLA